MHSDVQVLFIGDSFSLLDWHQNKQISKLDNHKELRFWISVILVLQNWFLLILFPQSFSPPSFCPPQTCPCSWMQLCLRPMVAAAMCWSRRCYGTAAVRFISTSVQWRGMWRKWAPPSIPSLWVKITYEAEWEISQEDYFILNSLLSALFTPFDPHLLLRVYSFIFRFTSLILSVSISGVLHINFLT